MKFTNEISIWNCHLFPLIFFDCHFKSHLINEDMYDVRSLSMNTVEELVGCVLANLNDHTTARAQLQCFR